MIDKRLYACLYAAICLSVCGCFSVSVTPDYEGPPARPQEVLDYYAVGSSYHSFHEEIVSSNELYSIKRISIASQHGETLIDFYQRPEASDDLILVFPLLGGSNKIADYFAEYYAEHGFDTAIVHRNNDFKNPDMFLQIEEVLRANAIRDRVAIDVFEREYGKKDFGSFGISRGAINVAITAGIDARLKYNVIALGATDIVRIMQNSNEQRIEKYKQAVMTRYVMSEKEFFGYLRQHVRTDPKNLASYLDARHTLLFLGLLDKTVPIQYGVKLRQAIGGPKTIYLLADHYLSAGFSQLASMAAPGLKRSIFPFDYIEQEALDFYRKSFNGEEASMPRQLIPFRVVQAPFNMLADVVDSAF